MLVAIDFEYNKTKREKLNLVCSSIRDDENNVHNHWLLDDEEKEGLINTIESYKDDTFLCYSGEAEGSSFISLGLNPFEYKCIDVMIEYAMLLNHNKSYMYGMQLVDGKPKLILPPDRRREGDSGGKASKSMAAACYKVLGKVVDTDRKDYIRDLIISNTLLTTSRKEIQEYCESDTEHLISLFKKIAKEHMRLQGLTKKEYMEQAIHRGQRSFAITAYITRKGYPIAYKSLRNFSHKVPDIKEEVKRLASRKVMKTEGFSPFTYSIKDRKWKTNQKAIRTWISKSRFKDSWGRTEKGLYSLAGEEIEKHCSSGERASGTKPSTLLGQLLEVQKVDTSVSSISPTPTKKGGKTLWDFVCTQDKRVRPYLNPFGSQSGRWQPSSTSYILLKTAWIRSCLHPPKDKLIVAIDYGQQEFLIGAILSDDKEMLEAYRSGDTYLHTGKKLKIIPEHGTKRTHAAERQAAKGLVLGIAFGKTEYGLAWDLEEFFLPKEEDRKVGNRFKTFAEKKDYLESQATLFLEKYKKVYSTYFKWVERREREYHQKKYKRLSSGWTMYGDNPNMRSVMNFDPQGSGADILQLALSRVIPWGLKEFGDPLVVGPLHDAAYMEIPLEGWEDTVKKLRELMLAGFNDWVRAIRKSPEDYPEMRTDIEVWGDYFEYLRDDPEATVYCSGIYQREHFSLGDGVAVDLANVHADERLQPEDYEHWSQYFSPPEEQLDW